MEKEVAKKISDEMRGVLAALNESIRFVQENCTQREFEGYRSDIAKIMASVGDVMNHLYSKFPDIMPDELK
jgi:hypothetical protein